MIQADSPATTHSLTKLPEGSKLRGVTAVPAEGVAGHRALRVELTMNHPRGEAGVDYVDMPTFVIIPADFTNGTIEVDILSRLNGKGPPTPEPSPASPTGSLPTMATTSRPSTCAP